MMADANIITIAAAAASSVTAVAGLGWWLSGRFRNVENAQRTMLDRHEDLDQKRHEENLRRFEKISVALARLGSDNGTSDSS